MKQLLLMAVSSAALLIAPAAYPVGDAGSAQTQYLIRVTSEITGQEVRFEGAVLIKSGDAPFLAIAKRTPFEFRSSGYAASAMFRSHDDATMLVEVVGSQAGRQVTRSTATGRAIVVGNNIAQEVNGFITSF